MSANYPPSTRPCGHCGRRLPAAQPICPKCAWVQEGGYFDPGRRSYLRWMKIVMVVIGFFVVPLAAKIYHDQVVAPRVFEQVYGAKP